METIEDLYFSTASLALHGPVPLGATAAQSLNKLFEEWSTIALTEHDELTRFRVLAARGNPKRALQILDKVDAAFAKKQW